jgi:hypothetical protein
MQTPRLVVLLMLSALTTTCRSPDRRKPSAQAGAKPSSSSAPVAVLRSCPIDTGQAVSVSRHCFGSMPVDSTLGFLAAHFPGYHVDTQNVEDTPVLVWFYIVRGDTAQLSQQVGSMDLARPAYEWRIWGDGILLPGGVPLPKNWGDLRAHFPGPAFVTFGELGSQVEICELNGVRIDLGRGEDVRGLGFDEDVSAPADRVNPATGIGHVVIYPTLRDSDCH